MDVVRWLPDNPPSWVTTGALSVGPAGCGGVEVENEVVTELLEQIRERVLPMLRLVAAEYRDRVPTSYPVIIDTPDRGVVGIELDPSYALYFVSDGERVWADLFYRSPRNDARSSASREKFGGVPTGDRRPLDGSVSDQALRNLIAELLARWNAQPMIIHITDT